MCFVWNMAMAALTSFGTTSPRYMRRNAKKKNLPLVHDGEKRAELARRFQSCSRSVLQIELVAMATADHGHGVTFATLSFANTGTRAVASEAEPRRGPFHKLNGALRLEDGPPAASKNLKPPITAVHETDRPPYSRGEDRNSSSGRRASRQT